MNVITRYREAVVFYALAAMVLAAVAIGPDGNAKDGHVPVPQPSSTPAETPIPSPTPPSSSPTPAAPTSSVPVMPSPPVTLPPSTVVTTPTVITIPTPTPTITPLPHNKAKGLKDGCLVQKKKWLLKVPCPQAHHPESTP